MLLASVPAKSIPAAAATELLELARASLAPKPCPAIVVVHFVGYKAGGTAGLPALISAYDPGPYILSS